MKESRYNYFAEDEGKVICLNGVSGNVLDISTDAYRELKHILSSPEKANVDKELSQSLYELGFLIDDDFDEIEFLRKRYHSTIQKGYYHLTVNPTLECNFRCWYCYESHNKGHMTPQTLESLKELVEKTIKRDDIKIFELGWFGGEPLLYFDEVMYPLAKYTHTIASDNGKGYFSSMTSNGYYLTKDVIKKCQEIKLNSIQITLDGNRELHNKTRNNNGLPSFDVIINNIIDYCKYDRSNHITLRINYTDEVIKTDFKKVFELFPEDIRSQIRVNFQRVWQTIGVEKSTDSLIDNVGYIEKMGFMLSHNASFALYRGRVCYADSINYANVNYDGSIYRCTANEYKKQDRLGYLDENGEIVWERKELIDKVMSTPTFENEMCLKCKNLAICGGLCFNRRMNYLLTGKLSCVKSKLDTGGVSEYLKEYYKIRLEKRRKLNME